jgi:hypothetical protein
MPIDFATCSLARWRALSHDFLYLLSHVIPAQAGIHAVSNRAASLWIPAFAGMTGLDEKEEARDAAQRALTTYFELL